MFAGGCGEAEESLFRPTLESPFRLSKRTQRGGQNENVGKGQSRGKGGVSLGAGRQAEGRACWATFPKGAKVSY